MSSLFSRLSKGDYKCDGPESQLYLERIPKTQPALVNINEFARRSREYYEEFPDEGIDATPCRSFMWLEYNQLPQSFRTGIYIRRLPPQEEWVQQIALEHKDKKVPEKAAHHVFLTFIQERFGVVQETADASIFVDAVGRLVDAHLVRMAGEREDRNFQADADWANLQLCIAFEVLTVMNTLGTRMDPPLDKAPAEIVKPERAPHSVWHTIHLPRFKAPPLEDAMIDGPVLERREHWVRGHRKDYRDGKGLFGRVKALIWVPEHQRGNPELGTVKQSFVVKKPEA